jgi:hypothetical protein
MNCTRFLEPASLAAIFSGILLLLQLSSRTATESATAVADLASEIEQIQSSIATIKSQLGGVEKKIGTLIINEGESRALQMKDFGEAVSAAESLARAGEFVSAFDMVMVASRLAPSDPRIIDLVVKFIENAISSKEEEALEMAEDLLDRGDSLVYFQAPSNIAPSRKRLNELRQSFLNLPASSPLPAADPLDSVQKLLVVASNKKLPLNLRSRAVEQARAEFDDFQLEKAFGQVKKDLRLFSNEFAETLWGAMQGMDVQNQIQNAEKEVLKDLFLRSKSRADKCLVSIRAITKAIESTPADNAADLMITIDKLLREGLECSQELLPYSKSDVQGATAISDILLKQLKILERQKDWLYNKQILLMIREIESNTELDSEKKVEKLAEVNEETLEPYVLRRHNELWDKVFESLSDEDQKVSALRRRILRAKE